MDIQKFGMRLAENSLSVLSSEWVGLSDMILKPNDSQFKRNLKSAVVWEIMDQVVMMVRYGTSYLSEGHYYILADNIGYNTAVITLLEKSGLGVKVSQKLDKSLPFSNEINDAIATGVIKVSAKVFKDISELNYQDTPLKYVNHWTTLVPQVGQLLGRN